MELLIVLLIATSAILVGIVIGWFLRFIVALGKKGSMELEIKERLLEAREEAEKITTDATEKAEEIIKEAKNEIKKEEEKLQKTEDRLIAKESLLDERQTNLDLEEENLKKKFEENDLLKNKLKEKTEQKILELQNVSSLSKEEAKEILLEQLKEEMDSDLQNRIQKMELADKEMYDKRAKNILVSAIERLGVSVYSENFTSAVNIANEEIKGKIIGKDGRNIKTFERNAGVELIVDDTPGIITISTFDPIRREIAKQALENLIQDGRIQPAKIEEEIEKAKKNINKVIKEKGEKAAFECGVIGLDPKILLILGRLHFRTSYGQNVLQHSIEMAHMAGMIAEEIGVDVKIAKAGALLHDIGKAIDHEVSGSHVEIGRRILQKFGADEQIIKAMQSHHQEYPFETPESVIVYVTDSISGGRPGARKDTVENYLKRLGELEIIADSFAGVEKSYALQAGREIRVFVKPEEISDFEAKNMAKNIAKKIEEDLKYPGEIKITLIRENRVIEYAR
ncbi:MAG TPA: ribonuclease Y [Candidatus Paceibacterota bacterium]|mgnify:CR=1 FL=1|nr:ribonuclease Y [Candidatus Paceibacterota bacterium]HMP19055.1 ribonuclease Y [Candidatus Paceibacterota bacterium]HMP85432.1 ribonuclease Y [Candidatus Paceibacterota bacterium]